MPVYGPTGDIFPVCHSGLPTLTTTYSLEGGGAQAVGGNGNLTFSGLAAGNHTIAQQDGVPLDFAHLRVFCSDQTAGSAAKEIAVNVNSFTVKAVAGDEIVCDVYTIPENASGQTPTPAPTTAPQPTATTTSGGTTQLPSTGVAQSGGSNSTELALFGLAAVVVAGAGFATLRRRGTN